MVSADTGQVISGNDIDFNCRRCQCRCEISNELSDVDARCYTFRQPAELGETLRDLMGANGWRGTESWVGRANEIAPTVVGGSTIATPLAKGVGDGKFALEVVHGLHLSNATSWYMLADNQMNPTWTFLTHREYPIPQIFEVDAQLTASRKFRIEYPTAVITNHLNPGTNTKPVGAYKNT